MDSSRESAEAACDILSKLVNCSLKTLRLISTARPSFMELPKVSRTSLRPWSCGFRSVRSFSLRARKWIFELPAKNYTFRQFPSPGSIVRQCRERSLSGSVSYWDVLFRMH